MLYGTLINCHPPIVGHGTPHMTPEPLGPFMLRLVPIWEFHPEPIDGWLTSLWPQPRRPCPCVCMWRIVHHCPTESPASHCHLCHHMSQPTKMPETPHPKVT